MRAVIQRVTEAHVIVHGEICAQIGGGICALIGVSQEDALEDALWIARKIASLRIFDDSNGKMNLSLQDTEGTALVISQFTLYGDARKGRRPSFTEAAENKQAEIQYRNVCDALSREGVVVRTGIFGAHMAVSLINDGPVTLLLDSKKNI